MCDKLFVRLKLICWAFEDGNQQHDYDQSDCNREEDDSPSCGGICVKGSAVEFFPTLGPDYYPDAREYTNLFSSVCLIKMGNRQNQSIISQVTREIFFIKYRRKHLNEIGEYVTGTW